MASAVDSFEDWLSNKLRNLNTDEGVFGSYITGILDGDDDAEEKTEALKSLLSEIIETECNIVHICSEIMDVYIKFKSKQPIPGEVILEDVDVKLAKMLESQCLATTKQKEYTAEEKKIREAILSQYSQMTDDEDDTREVHVTDHKEHALGKNTNVFAVQQAERERREQAKLDSQKKKDKDKEDREKQKQMKEEKKEKRKTQKGERRR